MCPLFCCEDYFIEKILGKGIAQGLPDTVEKTAYDYGEPSSLPSRVDEGLSESSATARDEYA